MRSAAPAIKSALGTIGTVLKTAFDAFTSLPKEVQALLVGGFAVNKLTGGLISNIAGGVFGALKAMTVQAGVVNVTGGVVNGGGGLPGGKTPGGKGGGIPGAVAAVGVAGLVLALAEPLGQAFKAALPAELKGPGGQGQSESQRRILDAQREMNKKQSTTIQKITTLGVTFGRGSRDQISTTERVKQAAQETKREAQRGLAIVRSQTSASGHGIEATIRANRPIVSVNVAVSATTVTKKTTINNRYGPAGGSRNTDSNGSGTLGNGGR
jgi:hypothetical protein